MDRFYSFRRKCQSIRILTQKQSGKLQGSIALTYATLASIAKYPCESVARNKDILHRKKFGFSS